MQHSFLAGPTVDIEKGRPKNNGVRHQLSSISEWGWVVGRLVSMQNKLLLPLSKSIDVSYNLYDFDDFKNAFAEHAQSLKQRLWTAVILIFKNHKVKWDPMWRISIHRDFDSLGGDLSPCGSHWLR